MPLMQIKNLELGYGNRKNFTKAAGPVSFSIEKGEALGLIGESGAGKSTLGLEILSLLRFKGGLRLGGEIVTEISGRRMAYIPQDPSAALDPLFSIGSQLRERSNHSALETVGFKDRKVLSSDRTEGDSALETVGFKDRKVLSSDRTEGISAEIQEALDKVHLSLDKISLKSYPHELSGGMKQRVLIAMALLRRPEFIVMDEPTSSLDVTLQAEMMALFREIRSLGLTFLFITHNLPLAANFCERIAIMQSGKIVEMGKTREIFSQPQNSYTRMLMDAVPRLEK